MAVTSGTAVSYVGRFKAGGLSKKRIRYELTGHSAFKVSKKKGIIKYNGQILMGTEKSDAGERDDSVDDSINPVTTA